MNLAGEAAKTREKFIDEQERDRQAEGVTRSIAKATTRKQCEGVLLPEFVLPFELGPVRLAGVSDRIGGRAVNGAAIPA